MQDFRRSFRDLEEEKTMEISKRSLVESDFSVKPQMFAYADDFTLSMKQMAGNSNQQSKPKRSNSNSKSNK